MRSYIILLAGIQLFCCSQVFAQRPDDPLLMQAQSTDASFARARGAAKVASWITDMAGRKALLNRADQEILQKGPAAAKERGVEGALYKVSL
jgi:hypothetical protein